MSTPGQPAQGPGSFAAQSLHVTRQPDEILATLSRVEFRVLQDGEVNQAQAGRERCLGFLVSAVIGIVGLIATVNWDAAFHQVDWAPFVFTGLLFAVAISSGIGACIYHGRHKRTRENSAYSDLMKRLTDHFSKH
jgi:hypothetical protein